MIDPKLPADSMIATITGLASRHEVDFGREDEAESVRAELERRQLIGIRVVREGTSVILTKTR